MSVVAISTPRQSSSSVLVSQILGPAHASAHHSHQRRVHGILLAPFVNGKISAGHGWTARYLPGRGFSHISDTDISLLFPKSHLHTHTSKATSFMTRIPRVAMANRVMTSTPQQPGLPQVECATKALIRYSDGATFSSSRGIIGIMGLSSLLPLVSPCPDGLVLAARSDHLAIGSPSDGIHLRGPVSLFLQSDWFTMHIVTYLVLVAWKIHGHVSCPHVPDFEGGVLASCDQEPAVRAPGALVDLCGGVRLGGSIKA